MTLAIPHTQPLLFRIPFYMLWSERTWLTYLHGYIPMADITWIAGDWQRGLRKLKILWAQCETPDLTSATHPECVLVVLMNQSPPVRAQPGLHELSQSMESCD